MRGLRLVSTSLVLFLLSAIESRASQVISMGSLGDIDDVSIQGVMIGNSLALNPEGATSLFASDRKKVDEFKTELLAQVVQHLKKGGLDVSNESKNALGFNIFGGQFTDACPSQNFFMLELWVYRPGESQSEKARTILGVADDAHLSSKLIEAALAAIDGEVNSRSRWRESRHE